MGQQSNKIIKRRRRLAYIERKKTKGFELAAAAKPKAKKAPAAKKEKAAAPAPEPAAAE